MWRIAKIILTAIVLAIAAIAFTLSLNYFFPKVAIFWWVLLFVLFLAFVFEIINARKQRNRLIEISKSRLSLSKFEYIEIVCQKGYEVRDIEACYDLIDYYRPRLKNLDFSIYPEDDILDLYCIDLEDLSDDMEKLFKKFNLTWLSNAEFKKLNEQYQNKVNIYHLLDAIKIARNSQNNKEG